MSELSNAETLKAELPKEMTNKNNWWQTSLGLAVLAVVLIVVVTLVQQLPAWRVDFTEDNMYTLSDGTHNIVNAINGEIALDFYFSDQVTQELPQLRDYAQRVEELLTEYHLLGGDNVAFNIIDPEPFSEAEDAAVEAGLQGVPGPAGDAIFFGLVGRNNVGDEETISFFNPEREQFLEYDISQLIYRLANADKTVVGVLSPLQMFGGFDFATRQQTQAWLIIQQLQQLVEVRELEQLTETIDADVDVLMVVHPQGLSEQTLYAVDQFILSGGRAIIAVDPHAELAAAPTGMPTANSSNVPELFSAWGINYDPTQVVADGRWALRLSAGEQRLQLPHLGIIGVGEESLNRDDIATAELETVNFATTGFFSTQQDAPVTLTPLVTSSAMARPLPVSEFVGLANHGDLLRGFTPTEEIYTLVARVSGDVASAFPDGKPAIEEEAGDASGDGSNDTESNTAENTGEGNSSDETEVVADEEVAPHLAQSQDGINVLLIADTDVLTDRLWVQVSNFFGQTVAAPWANNGDLITNAVESLAGSSDLIGLRSRGTFSRPFTVVQELQVAAAERFQAQEQELVTKLEELEQRIQSLSQNEEGQIILELNQEQQAEIESFEAEKLRIRKELRQVQHQLNSDIESLEARLKFYNILLVPILLVVIVVALTLLKARQRRISK